MNNYALKFYDPTVELDEKFSNIINIYKIPRGSKKCDIIVKGFNPNNDEDSKKFVKIISKTGGSGTYKMIEKYDTTNKVYIFSGDKRTEIINTLINDFGCDEDSIIKHG